MKIKRVPKKIILFLAAIAIIAATHFLNEQANNARQIASDPNSGTNDLVDYFDLSEIEPARFAKAAKYQILKDVRVQQDLLSYKIQLGLFLIKDESGKKVFYCEKYHTIDLVFSAEGVSYSGTIPQMILRIPCIPDGNQTHTVGFDLDFDRIFKSPINTTTLDILNPDEREGAKLFITGVQDEWPTEWNWSGVVLHGLEESTLKITGYEIISVLGKPLTIPASPKK